MKHGLYTTYVNQKCRCELCRMANTNHCRHRRRQVAYGLADTHVPIDKAQAHLKALQAEGFSVNRLVELSGVNRGTVCAVLYGNAKRIRQSNFDGIMRVRGDAGERNLKSVPSFPAVRRLQALCAIGFSFNYQANYLGMKIQNIWNILQRDSCHPDTIARIAEMYEALAYTRPAPRSQQDKAGITKALNRAKKFGYAPPMAWDDIDRDVAPIKPERDPDFIDPLKLELRLQGAKVRFTRAESFAATFELADRGFNQLEIADILFITQSAVQKRLARAETVLP